MSSFLRIDGVAGESTSQGFEQEIEVLDWSWGLERSESERQGGGAGRVGKPHVHDLSIRHRYDAASPVLATSLTRGTRHSSARLSVVLDGDDPRTIIQITFSEVTIDSIGIASGADERPSEAVTVGFRAFAIEYRTQRPDGSPGDVITSEWDSKRNV